MYLGFLSSDTVKHTNMKMTVVKEDAFILRSLETASTPLPHRAIGGSARVSQEVEGVRQSLYCGFPVKEWLTQGKQA